MITVKEISINQAYRIACKAREIEEDRREEFAEAAIESIEQIRKSDAEADRRADIAGMFCKAFEKAVLLVPSEENVGYWVACCLMDQRSIRLEIDNAEEVMRKFGVALDESIIENVIRNGTAELSERYLNVIQTVAKRYVAGIMRRLREHEYDPESVRLYIVGGVDGAWRLTPTFAPRRKGTNRWRRIKCNAA